jgi:hypothetical protein
LEGKGLIWTLLKTDNNFGGKIVVFLNENKLKKRLEVLDLFNVPYLVNRDIESFEIGDGAGWQQIFEIKAKFDAGNGQKSNGTSQPSATEKNLGLELGLGQRPKTEKGNCKEVIVIAVEQLSEKVVKFLDSLKMQVTLTVLDSLKYDWFHLSRRFEFSQ